MNNQDIIYILRWFLTFFVIGISFLPITLNLFNNFRDKGYIFSKIIGMIVLSYFIFILGILRLSQFSFSLTIILLIILFVLNYSIFDRKNILVTIKKNLNIFIFEEIIFFITLVFWSFIRSHMPDIFGLEKFMDFGFLNSILRSDYFPPKDMWYTPLPINYYYFGHLITAVLTKISQIPSFISYNLMITTLFALTFTSAFSIAVNLLSEFKSKFITKVLSFIFPVFLAFGGNLTTIYTFFKPYTPADMPIPFWNLQFLPFSFPNDFWYPNATRFIPFTIHEFPIYSFVVSDLHGHVLDIPIVLLTIAFLFSIILRINKQNDKQLLFSNHFLKIFNTIKIKSLENWKFKFTDLIIVSFLLAIMYMANAWDGLIYFLLTGLIIIFLNFSKENLGEFIINSFNNTLTVGLGFLLFSLPFSINFKPFVSGIGILCAPGFLTKIGKIGPFLFEANHCQKSPIWQLLILYGFFYFFVFSFISFLKFKRKYTLSNNDKFVLILIILSTILIVVPEFIYVKDIYPLHYRANTMFKLVYQSFIMLSLVSGYVLIKLMFEIKNIILKLAFTGVAIFLSFFILIYPFFAIGSYYNNLTGKGSLDGFKYMLKTYPQDYNLINWVNSNIKGQPVVLEANGDSYTEYARISANTGLPTVIGWPVHEWLWRGTYDIVAPRIDDVRTLYTTSDISLTKSLIKKYNISYVVVSMLEEKKYPGININKFNTLGKIVYQNSGATLYKITD